MSTNQLYPAEAIGDESQLWMEWDTRTARYGCFVITATKRVYGGDRIHDYNIFTTR